MLFNMFDRLYPWVIFSDHVEYIWNGRWTTARIIYFWTLFTLYKCVGEFFSPTILLLHLRGCFLRQTKKNNNKELNK